MADDGFSAARLFSQGVSYTYDDVIFLPGYIDFPADAVDLSTRLSRRVPLSVPCVASPMDTVSEAAMASLSAAAVVHSNADAETQASILRAASPGTPPPGSSPRPPPTSPAARTPSSPSEGTRSPGSSASPPPPTTGPASPCRST